MATRYVALLRGINVGGRNPVAMADLREAFEAEGYDAVSTYIQSGNVLFESDAPSRLVGERARGDARASIRVPAGRRGAVAPPAPQHRRQGPERVRRGTRHLPLGRHLPEGPAVEPAGHAGRRAPRGGRPGLAGYRRALLRPRERTSHPEPDEPHRRHPRVPADDDPQLDHDDQAARPARDPVDDRARRVRTPLVGSARSDRLRPVADVHVPGSPGRAGARRDVGVLDAPAP